jgi:methyl-accepting chemotaxis protein
LVDAQIAGSVDPRRRSSHRTVTDLGTGRPSSRIDEIASTLDDIATTLDEIKEEHCSASSETLDRMRRSVERATDAIDRLENTGSIPIVRRHGPADE